MPNSELEQPIPPTKSNSGIIWESADSIKARALGVIMSDNLGPDNLEVFKKAMEKLRSYSNGLFGTQPYIEAVKDIENELQKLLSAAIDMAADTYVKYTVQSDDDDLEKLVKNAFKLTDKEPNIKSKADYEAAKITSELKEDKDQAKAKAAKKTLRLFDAFVRDLNVATEGLIVDAQKLESAVDEVIKEIVIKKIIELATVVKNAVSSNDVDSISTSIRVISEFVHPLLSRSNDETAAEGVNEAVTRVIKLMSSGNIIFDTQSAVNILIKAASAAARAKVIKAASVAERAEADDSKDGGSKKDESDLASLYVKAVVLLGGDIKAANEAIDAAVSQAKSDAAKKTNGQDPQIQNKDAASGAQNTESDTTAKTIPQDQREGSNKNDAQASSDPAPHKPAEESTSSSGAAASNVQDSKSTSNSANDGSGTQVPASPSSSNVDTSAKAPTPTPGTSSDSAVPNVQNAAPAKSSSKYDASASNVQASAPKSSSAGAQATEPGTPKVRTVKTKDSKKGAPKDSKKGASKDSKKDAPKDSKKGASKDSKKDAPKDSKKDTSQGDKKGATQDNNKKSASQDNMNGTAQGNKDTTTKPENVAATASDDSNVQAASVPEPITTKAADTSAADKPNGSGDASSQEAMADQSSSTEAPTTASSLSSGPGTQSTCGNIQPSLLTNIFKDLAWDTLHYHQVDLKAKGFKAMYTNSSITTDEWQANGEWFEDFTLQISGLVKKSPKCEEKEEDRSQPSLCCTGKPSYDDGLPTVKKFVDKLLIPAKNFPGLNNIQAHSKYAYCNAVAELKDAGFDQSCFKEAFIMVCDQYTVGDVCKEQTEEFWTSISTFVCK
jgi:hypothetical protein